MGMPLKMLMMPRMMTHRVVVDVPVQAVLVVLLRPQEEGKELDV
jgi:hypothetical protein